MVKVRVAGPLVAREIGFVAVHEPKAAAEISATSCSPSVKVKTRRSPTLKV